MSDFNLELENERVAERRYAEKLRADAERVVRPSSFTGKQVPQLPRAVHGRLIGRVALRNPDEDLEGRRDFYIGEKHAKVDGVQVYSWTAPVACSFFRQNHKHDGHEGLGGLCDDVVVIRSFAHTNGQIAHFGDDRLADDAPERPFPQRQLTVPTVAKRPLPGAGAVRNPGGSKSDRNTLPAARSADADVSDIPAPKQIEIRAEDLLRTLLKAPRSRGLSSVLSTLQADQYELVTIPAMDSVVIEGQPGTGKTIIAAHRAAYFVNAQTPPENSLDGKVLVVGPTPAYSRHVSGVIDRLADDRDRVLVLSIPEIMQLTLGSTSAPQGPVSNSWQDVHWTLGRLARSAVERYRLTGGEPSIDIAYECVRNNNVAGKPLTQNVEWVRYVKALPPYRQARSLRAQWPLLSLIAWKIEPPINLLNIEHIIVDEAQDVSELEWFLLEAINEANAWTLLGDLNQRRSDHTHSNWPSILEVLAIDEDTPVRRLKRGYRSTKPILEFAGRLLPKEARKLDAFQHGGEDPVVLRVPEKGVGDAVVTELDRLIKTHPAGTFAIISVNPDLARRALRGAGWVAVDNDLKTWRSDALEVTVVEPDSARGLEFDAVVVVEPGDFPSNFGRQGPLYTALTRGNRELSVVHSKGLPDALRRR